MYVCIIIISILFSSDRYTRQNSEYLNNRGSIEGASRLNRCKIKSKQIFDVLIFCDLSLLSWIYRQFTVQLGKLISESTKCVAKNAIFSVELMKKDKFNVPDNFSDLIRFILYWKLHSLGYQNLDSLIRHGVVLSL